MTKTEALFLLNVEDHVPFDEVVDQYLEKCFEIRKFIFRTPLVLKLASKRAEQLMKLHQAAYLLVSGKNYPKSSSKAFQSQLSSFQNEFQHYIDTAEVKVSESPSVGNDPVAIVERFEKQEAQVKLLFSNVYTGDWLSFFLKRWVLLEFQFYTDLLAQMDGEIDQEVEPLKQAEKLPTPQLKQLLSSSKSAENSAENRRKLASELNRMQKALSLGI